MTLTAGSSLQNGRYVIQKLLRQSDFAVTYLANHIYLEQEVVLQTYNPALRVHAGFEQFCHLFREETRRRAKSSDSSLFKVLDAFDEDGLPYVVFNTVPGQAPPKLRDWLPLTKLTAIVGKNQPTVAEGAEPGVTPPPVDIHQADADIAKLEADLAASAPMPESFSEPAQVSPLQTSTNGSNATNGAAKQTKILVPAPAKKAARPVAALPKPRRSPLIPIALTATAVVGGLAGAGFGWAVRFRQPEPAAAVTTTPAFSNAPLLDFKNEQSFPPQGDWPVRETPDIEPDTASYEGAPAQEPTARREYSRVAPVREQPAVEEPLPEFDPYSLPDYSAPAEAIAPPAALDESPYKAPEPAPEYSPLPPLNSGGAVEPPAPVAPPPSKVPLIPPAEAQPDPLPPS